MKQFINGRECEIPIGQDGQVNSDSIRHAAGRRILRIFRRTPGTTEEHGDV